MVNGEPQKLAMNLEPQKRKSITVSAISTSISLEVLGPDAMTFVQYWEYKCTVYPMCFFFFFFF